MFAAISVLLAGVELAAMANMFHSKARAMKTRHFKTKARALMTLEHGRSLRVVREHESEAMPEQKRLARALRGCRSLRSCLGDSLAGADRVRQDQES